jgi:hypothetical protein
MSILSVRSVFIGILATLTMDVLSAGAYRLQVIAPLSPRPVGRWFASVARARPFHHDIGQTSPFSNEIAIGAPVHYAIGVTLALMYLLVTSTLGLTARNPIAAVGFGLWSNVLPWLLMFPAMGYGWFGVHGPAGTRLFMSSLITHGFYGMGLWLAASILS